MRYTSFNLSLQTMNACVQTLRQWSADSRKQYVLFVVVVLFLFSISLPATNPPRLAYNPTINQPQTIEQPVEAFNPTIDQPQAINQPPVANDPFIDPAQPINQPPVANDPFIDPAQPINQPPVAGIPTIDPVQPINQPPVANVPTIDQGQTINQPPVANNPILDQPQTSKQPPVAYNPITGLPQPGSKSPGAHWTSFENITDLFAFGDSWTSNSLSVCRFSPSPEGFNPSSPFPATYTSSNGPNWLGFLTHTFNRSAFNLYDLAIPGTTVDTTLVKCFAGADLRYQVTDLLGQEGGMQRCQWMPQTFDPNHSLFSLFFGMNDVAGCTEDTGCDIHNHQTAAIFESYKHSLTRLYQGGARNFLLLNAPPVSPAAAFDLPSTDAFTKANIKATNMFNKAHQQLARSLREDFEGTTVFEVDVWGLFDKVYHGRAQEVPFVSGIKNFISFCPSYMFGLLQDGSQATADQIAACDGLRPEEYLWNSKMHVQWPMHKAIAAEVVRVMDEYKKPT